MKAAFTRLLALTCAFVLLLGSALAEPVPSRTAVTIDGMRTAFFDEAGNYLPMLEMDGRLYAPALSLGSNLGVSVTADAQTLAVTVGGIRAAFFTPEGDYLSPLNVEGVVYVPLAAFAENLGYTVSTVDGAFAIVREQATATPAPTATPRPTAAPTQVPEYGHVPVSELNWHKFFKLETGHTSTSDSPNTTCFTWSKVVSCSPTTSYDVVNVQLRLKGMSTLFVSGSGTGSTSRSNTIYRSDYKDKYAYEQAIAFEQLYMAYDFSTPTVEGASGTMRMSWHEAEAILAAYYETAENYLAKDRADLSVKWFDLLSRVEYRDSAARKAEVQKQLKDAEDAARKAELDEQEQQYQAALADLDAGNYQQAIAAFEALSAKKYKDSAAQHKAAVAAEKQHRYDQADEAEKQGHLDAALTIFNGLKEQGYADAAARVAAIWYRRGVDAMTAGQYDEAVTAFTNAGDHQDAAARVKAAHYAKAEALLAAGQYDGAIAAFTKAGNYQNASAKLKAAHYARAETLLAAGDPAGAVAAFKAAGDHQDAAERIKAVQYAYGVGQMEKGNLTNAAAAFRSIPGYQDADELLAQLPVIEANLLMAAGNAEEAFRKLVDMETTDQVITARRRALYMIGMECLQSDNPGGAVMFFSASGYADWREKVKASWYAAGDYREAGNYPDAEERYQEGVYQQGMALYNGGDLIKAYKTLSTIHGYKDVDQLLSSREMAATLKEMLVEGWVKEGDIITFGSYAPIGGDGTRQPIEWIICNTSKYPYITLLSRYALDKQPYGASGVKWEQSSLRKWLNGTFLRTAFTQNEQNAIIKPSATNQNTRSLYDDHRKNADKVEAYSDIVFESSRLQRFNFGPTVTGERVPYWRTDGSIYGGMPALSDGEAYVRPTITINAKASGINWANCTYTHVDEKQYRAYRYDNHGFLTSTGVYEKDYGSYYGTSVYHYLQAGDYESALNSFSNGWSKTDRFDGLLYNEIRLHLAAEALINGDKAAAKTYLSGLYERFFYQGLKFHDFISPIANGN